MSDGTKRLEGKSGCKHPAESRSLLSHYDVICDQCGEAIGTIALFPDAVLNRGEARQALAMIGDAGEGSSLRAKLTRAARQ